MLVDLFDFELPAELIAQHPCAPREEARLLLVGSTMSCCRIADLPSLLRTGDHLVLNDTRVLPTRFFGHRGGTAVEVTLVEPHGDDAWWSLARPGRRLRPGDTVELADDLHAEVRAKRDDGAILLGFPLAGDALVAGIKARGAMPLPPYIARPRGGDPRDLQDYQPLFATRDGSVAAPTASLHLTAQLLAELAAAGVTRSFVTLHVGLGTFLPVKVADTSEHRMHAEHGEVSQATVEAVERARAAGGRIVAVGSTVLRTLESATDPTGRLRPWSGTTSLFLTPGDRIVGADLLLTNFHLPRSTLLMLVAAFAGLDRIRAAYALAIEQRFHFFSYGDACLLEREDR